MTKISVGKNNSSGGVCQICKRRLKDINEIWNVDKEYIYGDEPELTICNECLKTIICAFIDESNL